MLHSSREDEVHSVIRDLENLCGESLTGWQRRLSLSPCARFSACLPGRNGPTPSMLLPPPFIAMSLFVASREVRLPGKDLSSPEVFPFGTPYRDIYDTLKGKDERFFLQNNLLPLVARNATIKAAPERFQEIEGPDMAGFDVVLCFESRVFYLVVEGTYACNNKSPSKSTCGKAHRSVDCSLSCHLSSDLRNHVAMLCTNCAVNGFSILQEQIDGSRRQHGNVPRSFHARRRQNTSVL